MPVDADDQRRLDLIVVGLRAYHGLPLFCEATIISPISANARARAGTSNKGGALLDQATVANNDTYHEVVSSDLGALLSLGAEVYGRWSK